LAKNAQSQKEQIYLTYNAAIIAKNALEMSRYCFFSTLRDFSAKVCKVLQLGCRECPIAIAIQAVNRSRRRKYPVLKK
jgi:adenine-specific DNA glycosylase